MWLREIGILLQQGFENHRVRGNGPYRLLTFTVKAGDLVWLYPAASVYLVVLNRLLVETFQVSGHHNLKLEPVILIYPIPFYDQGCFFVSGLV